MSIFCQNRREVHRAVMTFVAALAVVAMTGCSTSDVEPGSVAAHADLTPEQQECVDAAVAAIEKRGGDLPTTLPEELTPLDSPPEEGIVLTRVYPGNIPTSAEATAMIIDGAEKIGWTGKGVTHDGTVEDANQKLVEVMGSSDIVATDTLDRSALNVAVQAAIDTDTLFMIGSTTAEPESIPGYGASPLGGDLYSQIGELSGYAYLRDSGCQGKVATFGLAVEALQTLTDTFEATVEANCADCVVEYTELNIAEVGAPAMTNGIVSKLQSDPEIDFSMFAMGDMALGLEPALRQAGLDIGIGGVHPTPPNLQALEAGDNAFWLGVPPEMTAWIYLDTAIRSMQTGELTVGSHYVVPIFTPENIVSTEKVLPYPEDYQEQFLELWQMQGGEDK